MTDILEKQKFLLKNLNESSMEHLLHEANVFLTHFKQGCIFYAQEIWAFYVDVGRFARTVASDIANKGVSGFEAELRTASNHVRDLTGQTHNQFVQWLSQQKYIPHEHNASVAWGMIFIIAFFLTLISLLILKSICWCFCPCCRRGKRRTENGDVRANTSGGKKSNHKKQK